VGPLSRVSPFFPSRGPPLLPPRRFLQSNQKKNPEPTPSACCHLLPSPVIFCHLISDLILWFLITCRCKRMAPRRTLPITPPSPRFIVPFAAQTLRRARPCRPPRRLEARTRNRKFGQSCLPGEVFEAGPLTFVQLSNPIARCFLVVFRVVVNPTSFVEPSSQIAPTDQGSKSGLTKVFD